MKLKKQDTIFRVFDTYKNQPVSDVVLTHWSASTRNTIKTTDSVKTTTHHTSRSVAGIYIKLVSNVMQLKDYQLQLKQLQKEIELEQNSPKTNIVGGYTTRTPAERINALLTTIKNCEHTIERGKNFKLQVGCISWQDQQAQEQNTDKLLSRAISDITTHVAHKIAHEEMRNKENLHVLSDFQQNLYKIERDKQGCYVVFTVSEPTQQSNVKSNGMEMPSDVVDNLRRSGISLRFVVPAGVRYDTVVYLKNHQDINLMQVISGDVIHINKTFMAEDLIKKHNAICKKTTALIKKYCGF